MNTDEKLRLLHKQVKGKSIEQRAIFYAGVIGFLSIYIPEETWLRAIGFVNGNENDTETNNRSTLDTGHAPTETE